MKYNLKLSSFKSLIFFYTYLRHYVCSQEWDGSMTLMHSPESQFIDWKSSEFYTLALENDTPLLPSNSLWADCFGLTNFNIIESWCLLFLLKLKTNRLIALPEATKFNSLGQSSPNLSYRRQQSKFLNLCEHTWMCHSCDILLWDNDFTL